MATRLTQTGEEVQEILNESEELPFIRRGIGYNSIKYGIGSIAGLYHAKIYLRGIDFTNNKVYLSADETADIVTSNFSEVYDAKIDLSPYLNSYVLFIYHDGTLERSFVTQTEGNILYLNSLRSNRVLSNKVYTEEPIRFNGLLFTPIGASAFQGCSALGASSHAEGGDTLALSGYSHTEGLGTMATNAAEHAEGKYNKSNEGTIHSVGIGGSTSNRKNAHEIMQDGKHFIFGIGGYDGTNPDTAKDLAAALDDLGGGDLFEKGSAENSAILKGETVVAGVTYKNRAISQTSVAIGAATIAGLKGWYYSAIDFTNKTITLSDKPTYILAGSTLVGGNWSSGTPNINVNDVISLVNNSKYDFCSKVTAVNGDVITVDSLPFTELVKDDGAAVAVLAGQFSDGYSLYIPEKPDAGLIDFGGGAFSEGGQSKASNICAHAEGLQTHAYGQYSHTEGRETKAGYAAHAEGHETSAKGEQSHAEGKNTIASGNCSHAEGRNTVSSGDNSHAEGEGKTDGGATSLLVGAHGRSSHAEGIATTTGEYNEQTGTWSKGDAAHAEGNGTTASGNHAHAEGSGTKALGWQSHAEGHNTVARGNRSHAEGSSAEASGQASHAEGSSTKASGESSHAEGSNTKAPGQASHAEGSSAKASGESSHAEGNQAEAYGSSSHAEGYYTEASGSFSHAEGAHTKTTNTAEHAEGKYNKSNVDTIHSVGIGTFDTDRKNAHEIMQDGKHYIYGIGGYDGTNPDTAKDLVAALDELTQLDPEKYWTKDETEAAIKQQIDFVAGVDLSAYYTGRQVDEKLDDKQDKITDLETIRTNASTAANKQDKIEDLETIRANASAVTTKQDKVEDLETIRTNASAVATKQDKIEDLETIRTSASAVATKQDKIEDLETIRANASAVTTKQDKIEDLETIRANALKGATAGGGISEADLLNKYLNGQGRIPLTFTTLSDDTLLSSADAMGKEWAYYKVDTTLTGEDACFVRWLDEGTLKYFYLDLNAKTPPKKIDRALLSDMYVYIGESDGQCVIAVPGGSEMFEYLQSHQFAVAPVTSDFSPMSEGLIPDSIARVTDLRYLVEGLLSSVGAFVEIQPLIDISEISGLSPGGDKMENPSENYIKYFSFDERFNGLNIKSFLLLRRYIEKRLSDTTGSYQDPDPNLFTYFNIVQAEEGYYWLVEEVGITGLNVFDTLYIRAHSIPEGGSTQDVFIFKINQSYFRHYLITVTRPSGYTVLP